MPGWFRVMVNGLQVGLGQAAPATIGTWSLRSQTFTAPANGNAGFELLRRRVPALRAQTA